MQAIQGAGNTLGSWGSRASAVIVGLAARDAYYSARRRYLQNRPLKTLAGLPSNTTVTTRVKRGMPYSRYRRRYRRRYTPRYRKRTRYTPRYRKRYSRRYRTYRRRRRAARRIGLRPYSRVSNKTFIFNYANSLASRTLYSWDMTEIARQSTASTYDLLGNRQRERIIVKGFLIRGCISALDAMRRTHVINMAIISPKHLIDGQTWTQTATQNFVQNERFFSAMDENQYRNFGTNLTAVHLNQLAINKQYYHVLFRKRFYVGPRRHYYDGSAVPATTQHHDTPNSTRQFRIWAPLRRQIKYERAAVNDDLAVTGRCAFVVWHDNLGTSKGGAATVADLVEFMMDGITYWSEIN